MVLNIKCPKIVFLDIDNTTYIHALRKVPESTMYGLRKLKDKGCKVFICTSRSLEEMMGLPKDYLTLCDGFITLAGSMIYVDNKLVHKEVMNQDEIEEIISYLDKEKITYRFVTEDGRGYLNTIDEEKMKVFYYLYLMVPPVFNFQHDKLVHLLLYPKTQEQFDYLNKYQKVNHINLGRAKELTNLNVTKGSGMEFISKYYGYDILDTIAFGDGLNDIEMLDVCGVGIAMGNANEKLKAISDYVTDDVDKDGLYKALVHFKWIEDDYEIK